MGCGGSQAKAVEVEQAKVEQEPAASTTLLDPASAKPAVTSVADLTATLTSLCFLNTADDLRASAKSLSPEVVIKVQAALAVLAKQEKEKAPAAEDDKTKENAKAEPVEIEVKVEATAAETPIAPTEPESAQEVSACIQAEVLEKMPAAADSKSYCCF